MATGGTNLPLLIFARPTPVQRDTGSGFPSTVHFPDHARQGQRVGRRLTQLQEAFDARRLELRASAQNDDPDLVLVLETIGSVSDFISAAQGVPGMEWLAARSEEFPPDEDFYDGEDRDKELSGKVFLVGSNRAALAEVVRLWERYHADERVKLGKGLEAWKGVFKHLRAARFWGPEDRLAQELRESWEFRLEHGAETVRFEIEAWHFASQAKNDAAAQEIQALVRALGGQILHACAIPDIAYHGFLVQMPAAGVLRLLGRDAALIKSERVMLLRAHGQALVPREADQDRGATPAAAPERVDGTAVLALFDGLPMANHALLQGRLIIDDPDGLAQRYQAHEQLHGTAMASLIALGDLAVPEAPLARPIYVRPIMQPEGSAGARAECTPDDRLLVDLVHTAVRRMFEATGGQPAAAPSVKVINLSVGDKHRLFDGELSPWARLLDWLQHKYGVLCIVSAGNDMDGALELDSAAGTLHPMGVDERSVFATRAVCGEDMHRRIFSPAESLNALTVGATHADASNALLTQDRFFLFRDGGLAPYSCIGPGFRRGIKPDILMPGGRMLYRESLQSPPGKTILHRVESSRAPGHIVAAPPNAHGGTVHSRGTSNATALAARWGARAHAVVESLRAGHPELREGFDAVLIKALLSHGASVDGLREQILGARPDVTDQQAQRRLVSRYAGLGVADVERALLCTEQRATLLGVGELKNNKALEFLVPVPQALHATVVQRRVTVTLAWMTPINPRHSMYRVARLWVDLPEGGLRGDRVQGEWRQLRRGTIHHEVFEGDRAVPVNDTTNLRVRVNCVAEAGRIIAPVQFALCVSLEVAPGVDLPIYEQVRNRVAPRVGVRAGD